MFFLSKPVIFNFARDIDKSLNASYLQSPEIHLRGQNMSINYNEIESTHLLFQKGMYFSEIVQKNGYILAYSNIIEDSYWNYATLINSDETERLSK